MNKLIIDLHALKTQLEFSNNWFMAAKVGAQIEQLLDRPCHFCAKPVSAANLKSHPDCLSKLYELVIERKSA